LFKKIVKKLKGKLLLNKFINKYNIFKVKVDSEEELEECSLKLC